ncbi:GNAT family N-acetyltransferase [Mucisphaera sp.]|uniref:GNAT family N-acetyltransferase n=1 Tax=Mucisphaera sp. TaxID=2913024 RepID=UPI003D0ABB0B
MRGEGRKLELLILGTRADHQQRGFGRAVMREVIRRAEAGGYEAVTLEVAKGTPAEGFYEREGFVGGKELAMKAGVLVMMRREITGTGD